MTRSITFVHVSNFVAGQFSLFGNHVTYGLPAITALCGFAQAMVMRLNAGRHSADAESDMHLRPAGVLMAVRAPSPSLGTPRFTRYEESLGVRNGGGGLDAPMADDRRGNGTFDLIIRIEGPADCPPAEADVRMAVHSLRFCSAELRTPDGRAVDVRTYTDRTAALRKLPATSWVVEDARQALQAWCAKTDASVDEGLMAFLARKSAPRDTDAKAMVQPSDVEDVAVPVEAIECRPPGMYVPVASGYVLLEEPRKRSGTRQAEVLHAFAEPVLGLARVRQAASVRAQYARIAQALEDGDQEPEASPAVFWRMHTDLEQRFVLGTATGIPT